MHSVYGIYTQTQTAGAHKSNVPEGGNGKLACSPRAIKFAKRRGLRNGWLYAFDKRKYILSRYRRALSPTRGQRARLHYARADSFVYIFLRRTHAAHTECLIYFSGVATCVFMLGSCHPANWKVFLTFFLFHAGIYAMTLISIILLVISDAALHTDAFFPRCFVFPFCARLPFGSFN